MAPADAPDTDDDPPEPPHRRDRPPLIDLGAMAPGDRLPDRFFVDGGTADLWFERRSDVLFVTFDNLATVDEPAPRLPWLDRRIEPLGYSVLGVQSRAKDWYRRTSAPDLLRQLQATGFFAEFRQVILMGASMGGFAALNYAPLIPGSSVLAFSPQSSMSTRVAPFEHRFAFSVKRSDWDEMPFLDAAAAVPYIPRVAILYDPFVPEDRAHFRRLAGPNVQEYWLSHGLHEAIRLVIHCDAFPLLLNGFVRDGAPGIDFWRQMRQRRTLRKWNRRLIEDLSRNHPLLTVLACDYIRRHGEDYTFARQARRAAAMQLAGVK